jgi:hypothetical protein
METVDRLQYRQPRARKVDVQKVAPNPSGNPLR